MNQFNTVKKPAKEPKESKRREAKKPDKAKQSEEPVKPFIINV